ncbi:DNA-3-methyladenine glycosylase 2 family protein [Alcaligenaceae bacterium]|nr:DNA-3-methyladenine glycosylase 2 family protein [Alcaligenaceae bacterium]
MIYADLSPAAYQSAERFLAGLDADWARHVADIGPCLHAATPAREPYEALIRAIAYQQLHAKAAEAILGRLLALYPETHFPTAQQLLASDPEQQRACGLSSAKLVSIRGIAQATLDGVVPTRQEALALPDEALIDRLTTLRGVGRWTVEMFLIYSLERSDILPVDDFAVREGYKRLKGLETAPTRKQMLEIGRAWSPYRTMAAWYLWRLPAR